MKTSSKIGIFYSILFFLYAVGVMILVSGCGSMPLFNNNPPVTYEECLSQGQTPIQCDGLPDFYPTNEVTGELLGMDQK